VYRIQGVLSRREKYTFYSMHRVQKTDTFSKSFFFIRAFDLAGGILLKLLSYHKFHCIVNSKEAVSFLKIL